MPSDYLQLSCPACSWSDIADIEGLIDWLRPVRKFREGREPEWDIVVELVQAALPELTCPKCGQKGLRVAAVDDEADWPEPVACEVCGKPVPEERLEFFPGAKLCAACQQADDDGHGSAEVDYCSRCGAPLELRPSRRGGITRYVPTCTGNPPCR